MQFLSLSCVELYFPSLDNRSGTVKQKWEGFIAWYTESQRICSKHVFHSKSRSNRRTCVCSGDADHILFYSHERIITGKAKMAGITSVSYTHLRAHETDSYIVCRLLLEK